MLRLSSVRRRAFSNASIRGLGAGTGSSPVPLVPPHSALACRARALVAAHEAPGPRRAQCSCAERPRVGCSAPSRRQELSGRPGHRGSRSDTDGNPGHYRRRVLGAADQFFANSGLRRARI